MPSSAAVELSLLRVLLKTVRSMNSFSADKEATQLTPLAPHASPLRQQISAKASYTDALEGRGQIRLPLIV